MTPGGVPAGALRSPPPSPRRRWAAGGLRDTVVDVDADPTQGTGCTFGTPAPAALVDACRRFLARHRAGGAAWEALLDRGMAVDFDSRTASALAYLRAYRRAIALRRRHMTSRRPGTIDVR